MKNLKKNIVWNTIGTLTISFTSLIYTMIMTRYCNLDEVGIFSFCFSFACMMVTLASFGGRTYQVTDVKNEISISTYIITRYITVLFSFLLVIIYILLKDYVQLKNIILLLLCLFKFFEEISDVYYGIFQKKEQLYKVGQFQFIKSIINIALFFVGIKIFNNFIVSILLITCNNIIILLIERSMSKKIINWKFKFNIKEILKLLSVNFFICGYTFLSSLLVNSPKYAIDKYLTNDAQAIFNMLIMPATLVMLIGGFLINPIIVDIADKFNNKKIKDIKSVCIKILLILLVIGLSGLIFTYFIGTDLLEIIYNLSFYKYKKHLILVIIGAIIYTLTTILGTILIAIRKIKIQFYISIICSIFALIISDYFVIKYNLFGGFLSYLIIMIIRLIFYIILLLYVLKKGDFNEKSKHS